MRLILLLLVISFNAQAKTKICLAGSTVKIFKKYGESFINGAKLAVENNNDFEIKDYFYDRSPLAARKATIKMIQEKCNVIIGYSNINELAQAKDLAIKSSVPIISIYSNMKNRDDNSKIMTMQPDSQFIVKKVKMYLKKAKKTMGNTLIVTAANISTFQDYKKDFSSLVEKEGSELTHYDLLENKFDKKLLIKKIKSSNKDFDTVILLTRAVVASKVTNTLHKLGQNPFIIGTSNFGSTTLPAYFNGLENKEINGVYVRQHTVMDNDIRYKQFQKSYLKTFKTKPMVISGYVYDAINFLIKKKNHLGVTGVELKENYTTNIKKCFYILITKDGHSLVKGRNSCIP